ncbi:MAG TPA: hypothetical protein VIS51_01975 [Solirubrobacterales bacterium]
MNQELRSLRLVDPPTPSRIEAGFAQTPYRSMRARNVEAKPARKVTHGRRLGRAE